MISITSPQKEEKRGTLEQRVGTSNKVLGAIAGAIGYGLEQLERISPESLHRRAYFSELRTKGVPRVDLSGDDDLDGLYRRASVLFERLPFAPISEEVREKIREDAAHLLFEIAYTAPREEKQRQWFLKRSIGDDIARIEALCGNVAIVEAQQSGATVDNLAAQPSASVQSDDAKGAHAYVATAEKMTVTPTIERKGRMRRFAPAGAMLAIAGALGVTYLLSNRVITVIKNSNEIPQYAQDGIRSPDMTPAPFPTMAPTPEPTLAPTPLPTIAPTPQSIRTQEPQTLESATDTYKKDAKKDDGDNREGEATPRPTFSMVHAGENSYAVRSNVDGEIVIGGLNERRAIRIHKGMNRVTIDGIASGEGTNADGKEREAYLALKVGGKVVASVRGAYSTLLPHLKTAASPTYETPSETPQAASKDGYSPLEKSVGETAPTTSGAQEEGMPPEPTIAMRVDNCNDTDIRIFAMQRLGVTQQLSDLECMLDGDTASGTQEDTWTLYNALRKVVDSEVRQVRSENGCEELPEITPFEAAPVSAVSDYHTHRRGSALGFKSVDQIVRQYAKQGVTREKLLATVDSYGVARRGAKLDANARSERETYVMNGVESGLSVGQMAQMREGKRGYSATSIRREVVKYQKEQETRRAPAAPNA